MYTMPHYYLKSLYEFTNMAFPFDDVPFRINPNWRWKKTDEKTFWNFKWPNIFWTQN